MKIKELEIELQNYKELQRMYVRLLEDKSFRCNKCFEKLEYINDMDMDDGYVGTITFYHCPDCGLEVQITEYEHGDIDSIIGGDV